MSWTKPEIRKVELNSERPNLLDLLYLAMAFEAAFAGVGGMDQFIIDMVIKYGGVVKAIDLSPEIEAIHEPQAGAEIETCAAYCQKPCTVRR